MQSNQETANRWLWQNREFLTKLHDAVIADDYSHGLKNGCLISTRASGSKTGSGPKKSTTPYPVIRRKCPDGRVRRFYCHHVVMIHDQVNKLQEMWDTSKMQISHDCHERKCIKLSHLSLMTPEDNVSKTISCIGRVECIKCDMAINLCQHNTKCLTVVYRVCSKCEELK